MELSERIRLIIKNQQLNAGEFADRIGVQRSSVSHILSGRNKPGFEFIQRVVLNFPKVDPYWLLTGKANPSSKMSPLLNDVSKDGILDTSIRAKIVEPEESNFIQQSNPIKEKKVVKIALFYDDFTFETFNP